MANYHFEAAIISRRKGRSVTSSANYICGRTLHASYNGLPMRLRTRLKTKLHRSVYVEPLYYKGGKGVVSVTTTIVGTGGRASRSRRRCR